jgi:hypothetical protein
VPPSWRGIRGTTLAVSRHTLAPYVPEEQSALMRPVPRARPEQLPQVTTTAMERFACISDRCEDNCCRDWAVPLDRRSLNKMKSVMSRTAEGRERLHRLVVIGQPAPHVPGQAHIKMNAQGACPMLEPDSRCGVHAAFGEEALTTACSIFPRTAVAVGDHLEIGASLGCPEVGRLVLLAGDGDELRLRPANKAMLPRPYVGNSVSNDPTDAYAHHFLEVRELLLSLVARDELTLPARLMAAAHFAERVQPFFHAGTTEFEGPRQAFARRRLRAEIEEATAPALLATLERDLAAVEGAGGQHGIDHGVAPQPHRREKQRERPQRPAQGLPGHVGSDQQQPGEAKDQREEHAGRLVDVAQLALGIGVHGRAQLLHEPLVEAADQ